jgi:6-phosphogluconolactonase (cycloisomerase 2 family)
VVNRLDNTVSMFTTNATNGTLTLVASVATGSQPFRIAIDLSGHFAHVANENGASVSIYTLKNNNTLTAADTAATQGAALSVVLSGTN